MNELTLKISNSIIKITGIFESENLNQLEHNFISKGYKSEIINDTSQQFHKNYWYPEFRDIFFRKEKNEISSRILLKKINQSVTFLRKDFNSNEIKSKTTVIVDQAELFIFPNGLHFFSLSFLTDQMGLEDLSDITFFTRNFSSEIEGYKEELWVKWVENEILNGIKIHSKWNEKPIPVDEYSGSKFKLYTVIDLEPNEQINQKVIDELLYDIGCVAQIGSANGNSNLSPSKSYFDLLLEDKISAFNNFAMLPLFDTFTTIGYGLLSSKFQYSTYEQTYFRIYLFNLFIKYNLYRYNNEMRLDTVKTRDKFEKFLNEYNINPVSYNFLPNLIFEKHRKTMHIDEELKKFEERINRISQSIQEDQQNRMSTLLGIVGLVTSIGSIEPAVELMESVRVDISWSMGLFYSVVFILAVIIAFPILSYLFPEKKKQLIRKWRK
jgi:hypothetical protein